MTAATALASAHFTWHVEGLHGKFSEVTSRIVIGERSRYPGQHQAGFADDVATPLIVPATAT